MSYQKYVLIREGYDCLLNEQERMAFNGKLIKANYLTNEYSFAFKVEDHLMRMELTYQNGLISIKQDFSSASSLMKMELGKRHIYSMTIQSGHTVEFYIDTMDIVFTKDLIKLKYKLIDKFKEDTISINEIRIIGEN